MPGTVDYLTDKLMRGVDAEGNILDIRIVMEVVRDLEHTVVTAEDLKMTHLGRIVNETRRKITDKSLARRMKNLVKQWLKLASGLNGTAISEDKMSAKSTPSPASSDVSRRSTAQPPISHIPPTMQTTSLQHPISLSNSVRVPNTLPRLPSSESVSSHAVTSPAIPSVNGQSCSRNFIVKIPRDQLPSQEKKQEQKPLTELLQYPSPITSLFVRIPLRHVRLPWDCVTPTSLCAPTPSLVPSELIVSIKFSDRISLPNNSFHVPLLNTTGATPVANNIQIVSPFINDPVSYPIPRTPVRLKSYSEVVPHGSVLGVDGVVGAEDSCWHGWADCIPGIESLTMLPYVYIDGLSEYNDPCSWFGLEIDELADCL